MTDSSQEFRAKSPSTVIIVHSNGMGVAEEPLQQKLLNTYLTMLGDNEFIPGAICFYGDGVKMAVEGSPVVDLLRKLEAKGTHLIICTTCLRYYGLEDRVAVGIVGGMHDILLAQWMADKVITL
jgi:hypothetical protein